jgi:hypothetical protein
MQPAYSHFKFYTSAPVNPGTAPPSWTFDKMTLRHHLRNIKMVAQRNSFLHEVDTETFNMLNLQHEARLTRLTSSPANKTTIYFYK